MRSTHLPLIIGAGFGVGLHHDPFAPSRLCVAARHPRRDPDGHPAGGGGGGGTQGGENGSQGAESGTQGTENGTQGGGSGTTPPADDWATVFAGLTPTQVKAALDQATESNPKAEKYDQLLASLTGDGGGGSTAPSPEQLTTDLSTARQGERDAKLESAVLRSASRLSANGDRLTDSNSFMAGVRALDLDPAAADFASQIDGAVKAALDADRTLSIATPIGVVVPHEGRTPGAPPTREALIADAQSKGDHMKALGLKMAGYLETSNKK